MTEHVRQLEGESPFDNLIYVSDFADGIELHQAISRYIDYYNFERPHQSLHYATPARWFPAARDREPRR